MKTECIIFNLQFFFKLTISFKIFSILHVNWWQRQYLHIKYSHIILILYYDIQNKLILSQFGMILIRLINDFKTKFKQFSLCYKYYFIFCHRQLRVHRIILHQNLFFSLILNALLVIIFNTAVMMGETNSISDGSDVNSIVRKASLWKKCFKCFSSENVNAKISISGSCPNKKLFSSKL